MGNLASLHPSLIAIKNRYVYQLAGNCRKSDNVCRLDLNRLSQGWQIYRVHDSLTMIPRNHLSLQGRQQFDESNADKSQRFIDVQESAREVYEQSMS